jgi:hypothetical protein
MTNGYPGYTEARQQGEIDVTRHAWFAPPLDGDSTNKAGTPAFAIAEQFQLPGGFEKVDHRPSFASHCCISTRPEDGRGGMRNA